MQDGAWTRARNVAFDPNTGKPVITRSFDGYDNLSLEQSPAHVGAIDVYNLPAAHYYPEMGQKAANDQAVVRSGDLEIKKMKFSPTDQYLEFAAANPNDREVVCQEMGRLFPGDLVLIQATGAANREVFHLGDKIGNTIRLIPTHAYGNSNSILGGTAIQSIEVLLSGRTNQLSAATGEITTYGADRKLTLQPIPEVIMTPRKVFAASLNDVFERSTNFPVTIPVPDHLKILDEHGDCTFSSSICEITIDGNTILFHCGNSCKILVDIADFDRFAINEQTGQLEWYRKDNPCAPQPFTCFTFCPQRYAQERLDGVLDVSIQTYDDDWALEGWLNNQYKIESQLTYSPYEIGARGKWRPLSDFVYRTNIVSANGPAGRVYKDAGVFEDFALFNWKYPQANDPGQWLNTNTITKYSPNGNPIEDRNIQDIFSTAKFGYYHAVPYLVAQNTNYESVYFESFENLYDGRKLEDGVSLLANKHFDIDETIAHAGYQSLKSTPVELILPRETLLKIESHFKKLGVEPDKASAPDLFARVFQLNNIKITPQILNHGLSFKVWAKIKDPLSEFVNDLQLVLRSTDGNEIWRKSFRKIAKTGAWTLCEVVVADLPATFQDVTIIPAVVYLGGFQNTIWLDDLRMQPQDAQVSTYVYDPSTLRLLCSFDDQHFGTYFQYNAEGQLVRKRIETERGWKTLQETQYNSPKTKRE